MNVTSAELAGDFGTDVLRSDSQFFLAMRTVEKEGFGLDPRIEDIELELAAAELTGHCNATVFLVDAQLFLAMRAEHVIAHDWNFNHVADLLQFKEFGNHDLGLDKVFVHSLDVGRAVLAPHRFGGTAPGAGPRHFAFHPDGRHGYSVNELDLTVTGFGFDPHAGTLAPFQAISTLPADVTDRKGFSTAEIVAHPGGQFVYASNRGHNSIAMYAVDAATGRLEFLGVEPIRGQTPRNFVIDPSGRFLLAAGQDSDTVTVFAIDAETGRLSFTGQSLDVPSPVCIRFRPTSPPR